MSAVMGWQGNANGELMTGYSGLPQLVPVLSAHAPANVVQAVSTYYCSFTLDADGILWACGGNQQGELGQGDHLEYHEPVPVPLPAPCVEVAAHGTHVLARLADGRVASWGSNFYGQVGDGTTEPNIEGGGVPTPVILSFVHPAISVATGGCSCGVVLEGGGSYVWGSGKFGQLGQGTTTDHHTPVFVWLGGVKKIAMGGDTHACVTLWLKEDGTVWGAGSALKGQLGNTTLENQLRPVQLPVPPAADISAALSHTLTLDRTGKVWSFGNDEEGELMRTGPNPVPFDNVAGIAAGVRTSALILSDGTIQTAGAMTGRTDEAVIGPLVGVTGGKQVSIGEFHAVAIADPIESFLFDGNPVESGIDLIWVPPPTPPNTEPWKVTWRPFAKPKLAWSKAVQLEPAARAYSLRGLPSNTDCEARLVNHTYGERIIGPFRTL